MRLKRPNYDFVGPEPKRPKSIFLYDHPFTVFGYVARGAAAAAMILRLRRLSFPATTAN